MELTDNAAVKKYNNYNVLYQILELPGARPALPAFGICRYLLVACLLIPTDMLIFPLSLSENRLSENRSRPGPRPGQPVQQSAV